MWSIIKYTTTIIRIHSLSTLLYFRILLEIKTILDIRIESSIDWFMFLNGIRVSWIDSLLEIRLLWTYLMIEYDGILKIGL